MLLISKSVILLPRMYQILRKINKYEYSIVSEHKGLTDHQRTLKSYLRLKIYPLQI